ncbi:hypothetical protein [Rhabdaerophilum sp.]|uniref:hypothetical protein n=1 Tax=Rhabdaerophilum sp. TaxID=2717341 RepID=UPI0038D46FBC
MRGEGLTMHWIAMIGLAVVLIPFFLLLFAIDLALYLIGLAVLFVLGGIAWLLLGSEALGLIALMAIGILLLRRYGRDLIAAFNAARYGVAQPVMRNQPPKDPEARLKWANREGEFADDRKRE